MFNNYYNNDPDDITVHYRIYRSFHDEKPTVICVQNFDYPDYNEDRFLDDECYLNEDEAERKVLILENPDEFIPELYETHYRVYEKDGKPTVIELYSPSDYEEYEENKFLNDTYYRTYDEADTAAFYLE